MPPSAPVVSQHHQQQATESDGATTPRTIPSQEYNSDDNWNPSKIIAEHDNIKKRDTSSQHAEVSPLKTSDTNPHTATTPVPQTQLIQPPIDTGMNHMWNPNSMMGMNPPYNTYNTMNPSNSMYGNYGGFGNNNSTMMMNSMMNPMMNSMMSPLQQLPMIGTAGGPFSTITNYLLGIQNVIMSIGQVVQIISFNASSLQQLCESILAMMEHAIQSWHEQQQNHTKRLNHESYENKNGADNHEDLSPEEQQRVIQQQRRLRALRYTITVAITYIGYTIIRKLFSNPQQQQQYRRTLEHSQPPPYSHNNNNMMMMTAPPVYDANSYNPSTIPYQQNYTNPYWNAPPPQHQLQQPPPYHQYHNNTGPFQ